MQQLNINGSTYGYFSSQKYAGLPVMVFLHEALGSVLQWKDFYCKMQDELGIDYFVFDRVGHGYSSPLAKKRDSNYLHEIAFKELPTVLDRLLPQKDVVLFGHSDGGSIALLYAAKYPEKVRAIITEAAHVFVEKETLQGVNAATKAFEQGKLDGLRKYHGEKTNDIFYAWANIWRDPSFKNWDICSDIATIKSPLLAMQGKNDQYGTNEQLAKIKRSVEKSKVKEVDNCGHVPHAEQENLIIEETRKFLEANDIIFN